MACELCLLCKSWNFCSLWFLKMLLKELLQSEIDLLRRRLEVSCSQEFVFSMKYWYTFTFSAFSPTFTKGLMKIDCRVNYTISLDLYISTNNSLSWKH